MYMETLGEGNNNRTTAYLGGCCASVAYAKRAAKRRRNGRRKVGLGIAYSTMQNAKSFELRSWAFIEILTLHEHFAKDEILKFELLRDLFDLKIKIGSYCITHKAISQEWW